MVIWKDSLVMRSRVFPLHHLSMGGSGQVSNQICFRISVEKNGPVQAQRPSVETLLL